MKVTTIKPNHSTNVWQLKKEESSVKTNKKRKNNNLNLILIFKPPLVTFEITVLLSNTELMPRGQVEPPVQECIFAEQPENHLTEMNEMYEVFEMQFPWNNSMTFVNHSVTTLVIRFKASLCCLWWVLKITTWTQKKSNFVINVLWSLGNLWDVLNLF